MTSGFCEVNFLKKDLQTLTNPERKMRYIMARITYVKFQLQNLENTDIIVLVKALLTLILQWYYKENQQATKLTVRPNTYTTVVRKVRAIEKIGFFF